MTGWLVINEFLQSNKFNEIHDWLRNAAYKQKINLVLKTNTELLIDLPYNSNTDYIKSKLKDDIGKSNLKDELLRRKVDFVLFWDKDVKLASYLEQRGFLVFNSSTAIGICDDKSLTHLTLQSAGIQMPRTIIAPMTYANIGYTNLLFLNDVAERLGFPMVVKECFGSFGQQVYLVKDLEELKDLLQKTGSKPVLFQQYIAASSGRDIRLQVVGDQVIASMYRHSENGDFRANVTIGGKIKEYMPTMEQRELALDCCKRIGLDFAGVDILFGENDEPIVCEVNSNAHFKNIYDCTGVNAADAIITYIKNKINRFSSLQEDIN